MTAEDTTPNGKASLLQALAEFRYHLRTFTHFSEQAAHEIDLHPQQHQLLLQIAGTPDDSVASIAYAAERLGLRHHTVVELVDRSVAEGLLIRTEDPNDGRRVILAITKKGRKILQTLSEYHARELRELGPRLIRSLKNIEDLQKTTRRRPQ
jgi:DNA-binding MarR family transcriptional regulator